MLWFLIVVSVFASGSSILAKTSETKTCSYIYDSEVEEALSILFAGEIGFTLIGEKPVSVEEFLYCLEERPDAEKKVRYFFNERFKNSSKFIIKLPRNKSKAFPLEFIHIKALTKVIGIYPELQDFIKRKFGCRRGFFAFLKSSEYNIFSIFDYNDYLLGLVLGYGKTNSDYYCRRSVLLDYFERQRVELVSFIFKPNIYLGMTVAMYFLDIPYTSQPKPIPSPGFDSLEEEWAWIKKVEWDLGNPSRRTPPYIGQLPFYICRHGGDSEQVREQYERAGDQLVESRYNKSIMDVISNYTRS